MSDGNPQLSQQLAELQRQKDDMNKREQALMAREQSAGDSVSWDQVAKMVKENSADFLKKVGVEPEHFTAKANDPVSKLEAEIKAMKDLRTQDEANKVRGDKAARLKQLLSGKPEALELASALGLSDTFIETILGFEGDVSDEDVFKFAGEYEKDLETRVKPVLGLSRFKSPDTANPAGEKKVEGAHPMSASNTITQSTASGGSKAPDTAVDHESRLQRAKSTFIGQ